MTVSLANKSAASVTGPGVAVGLKNSLSFAMSDGASVWELNATVGA